MTGIELLSSDMGSDRSANWATTTALKRFFVPQNFCRNERTNCSLWRQKKKMELDVRHRSLFNNYSQPRSIFFSILGFALQMVKIECKMTAEERVK